MESTLANAVFLGFGQVFGGLKMDKTMEATLLFRSQGLAGNRRTLLCR